MDVMLSSSSNSLPAQVYDLNAFLLFRSVQFNPTLAQQSKYWQSSNLTSYGVPAFLCAKVLMKVLRARELNYLAGSAYSCLSHGTVEIHSPCNCPHRRQEQHFQSML